MSKIKIEKHQIQKLISESLGEVLFEQGIMAAKRKAWQEARKAMVDAAKKIGKSWKDIKSASDGQEAWNARLKARAAFKELQKAKGAAASSDSDGLRGFTGLEQLKGILPDNIIAAGSKKQSGPQGLPSPGAGGVIKLLTKAANDRKIMPKVAQAATKILIKNGWLTSDSLKYIVKNAVPKGDAKSKGKEPAQGFKSEFANIVPWCKKSNLNRVEKLICGNAELAKLEAKNVKLYRALYGNKVNDGLRNFIKKRNSCTDVECIKSLYEKRIQELTPSGDAITAPTPEPSIKRPSWATKLGSENEALTNQCPAIWVPYRRRVEVFLEKAEKEELVLFYKYPNREPANWREEIRKNMRIRESGLTGWVKRYSKAKSQGKLELKPERITAMIRNSGSIDKEGLKRMQLNLKKMIDCEIEYINSPAYKKKKQAKLKQNPPVTSLNVSPTPGAGGRPAKQPSRP